MLQSEDKIQEVLGNWQTDLPTPFAREDLVIVHCTIGEVVRDCGHNVCSVCMLVKANVSGCYVCLAMSLDTAEGHW